MKEHAYLIVPVLVRANTVQNAVLRTQLQRDDIHQDEISTSSSINSIEDLEDTSSVVHDCGSSKCTVCEKRAGTQVIGTLT